MSISPTEQTACVIFSKPNLFYYQIPGKKVLFQIEKAPGKVLYFMQSLTSSLTTQA